MRGAPSEFWEMTLREVSLAITGYVEEKKELYQRAWERARFISFIAISPYAKKGTEQQDIVLFDWEAESYYKAKREKHELWRQLAMKLHGLKEPLKIAKRG